MSIFMINPLINNIEFAQKQQNIKDSFDVLSFKRLAEILALPNEKLSFPNEKVKETHVNFELNGDYKRFRQPSLHLHIETKLPITCQRCLELMQVEIDLQFDYLISDSSTDDLNHNYDQNDDLDWVQTNTEMNFHELIEDELLLAMPISPMHASECSKTSMQSGEKPNPFAVLKNLIK